MKILLKERGWSDEVDKNDVDVKTEMKIEANYSLRVYPKNLEVLDKNFQIVHKNLQVLLKSFQVLLKSF
jgi:hypothetical protein